MEVKLNEEKITVSENSLPSFTWLNWVLGSSIEVQNSNGVVLWSESKNATNFISSPLAYGAVLGGDVVTEAQNLYPGNSYIVRLLIGCVMTRSQYYYDERSDMIELTGEFIGQE